MQIGKPDFTFANKQIVNINITMYQISEHSLHISVRPFFYFRSKYQTVKNVACCTLVRKDSTSCNLSADKSHQLDKPKVTTIIRHLSGSHEFSKIKNKINISVWTWIWVLKSIEELSLDIECGIAAHTKRPSTGRLNVLPPDKLIPGNALTLPIFAKPGTYIHSRYITLSVCFKPSRTRQLSYRTIANLPCIRFTHKKRAEPFEECPRAKIILPRDDTLQITIFRIRTDQIIVFVQQKRLGFCPLWWIYPDFEWPAKYLWLYVHVFTSFVCLQS